MKIVRMNGGLGNQLFQYIFLRYIEIMTGDDCCYIDDTFFSSVHQHNGYEIEPIFSLQPKRLSAFFDADVWEEIIEIVAVRQETNLIDLFKSFGVSLQAVSEGNFIEALKGFTDRVYTIPANGFSPDVVRLEGDIYYYGYWINANWLAPIKQSILKELAFPAVTDNENLRMLSIIHQQNAVGIHIRRGDFVTLRWDLSNEWYQQAVKKMKECVKQPVFVIFTDDELWVKEHLYDLGFQAGRDEILFSRGNVQGKNYIDMQLMTECKNLIISNSSFSYLAALLNQTPNKLVMNPVSFREIL